MAQSAWLTDFLARQDAIMAQKLTSPTPSTSSLGIAQQILRAPTGKVYGPQTADKGFFDGSHWWDDKTSFGSRVFDVLGRLNYASANFARASLKDPSDSGGQLAAAWAGLTGKEKTTYGDVLREHGIDNGWLGFGLDVFLDPTTYIPFGVIAKASKASGLAKGGRTKGLVKDGLPPTAAESAARATADNKTIRENLQAASERRFIPFNSEKIPTLADAANAPKALPAGPATSYPTPSTVVAGADGPSFRSHEFKTLEAQRNEFLTGVKTTRYPGASLEPQFFDKDIEQLILTEAVGRTFLTGATIGVRRGPEASATQRATLTAKELQDLAEVTALRVEELNDPNVLKKINIKSNGLQIFNKTNAQPVDHKFLEKLTDFAESMKYVQGFGANGKASRLTTASLIHFAKNPDAVPEAIKKYRVRQNKQLVTIEEVINSLRDTIAANSKLERISGEATDEWIRKHNFLRPSDMLALTNKSVKKPETYAAREAQVLAKTDYASYRTFQELKDDLASGKIPDDAKELINKRIAALGIPDTTIKPKKGQPQPVINSVDRLDDIQDHFLTQMGRASREGPPKPVVNAPTNTGRLAASPSISDSPKWLSGSSDIVNRILGDGEIPETFVRDAVNVTEEGAAIVAKAVKHANLKQFIESRGPDYKWKTLNTKAAKNSPNLNEGNAVHRRSFNAMAQMNMVKSILADAIKTMPGKIKGATEAERAAWKYDTVMPLLRAAEQVMRDKKLPITMGHGPVGFPMSFHDVLSSLDRPFVEKFVFRGTEERMDLGWTQLSDIIETYLSKASGKLTSSEVKKEVMRLITKPGMRGFVSPLTRFINTPNTLFKPEQVADDIFRQIDKTFNLASPKIAARLQQNSVEAAVEVGEHTVLLTSAAIKKFADFVEGPKFSGETVMKMIENLPKLVDDAAKNVDNGVSEAAKGLAKGEVEQAVASALPLSGLSDAILAAQKFQKADRIKIAASANRSKVSSNIEATNIAAHSKVAHGLSRSADEAALEVAGMLAKYIDLGEDYAFPVYSEIFRAFNPQWGAQDLAPVLNASISVGNTNARRMNKLFSDANRFSKDELINAFEALKRGEPVPAGVSSPITTLNDILRELVSIEKIPEGAALAGKEYGLLVRNGITIEQMRPVLKKYGIGDHFKLNKEHLDQSWRDWDIKDPLDFFSKFYTSVTHVVALRAFASRLETKWGRAVADAEHTVKIVDSSDQSRLAKFLDSNLYYNEEVARQMHMMDRALKDLEKPHNANALLNLLDQVTHSMKAGFTIYRPGHHVRNMVGDVWLSFMDGLTSPVYYKWSHEILRTNKEHYKSYDGMRALEDATGGNIPKPGRTILSVKVRTPDGEISVPLNATQIFRMAYRHAIQKDYTQIEDIIGAKGLSSDLLAQQRQFGMPRIFGGKYHDSMAFVSEYRDHYVRMAHFVYSLKQGKVIKGDSLEAALENAAEVAGRRVNKWHPDGSNLTEFEKQAARRTILFYSWQRKIIPLVLESALTRPGRFMVYPKAMQNLAQSNGIALDGYGDAFPSSQIFPEFMTDAVQGPQFGSPGRFQGINPGIPGTDTFSDYLTGNPQVTLQNVIGSISPIFRSPFELGTQTQARTGQRIRNNWDYISQQVPFGAQAEKATGRSPASAFLVPEDTAVSNEGYTGNDLPIPQNVASILNFILSPGITNYSKPSYIKRAQIEQR